MSLLFIIIALAFFFIWLYFYKIKYDTLIVFTGSMGSGKDVNTVSLGLKLLNKNRRKVNRHNRWLWLTNKFKDPDKKASKKPLPILYSNYPIRLKFTRSRFFTWLLNRYWNMAKINYDGRVKYNCAEYVDRLKLQELKITSDYIKGYAEFSTELTPSHLLLQKKLVEKSVTILGEIGSFANQFEYNYPNVQGGLTEFIRLYRHYTKGGYLIANDQSSSNIVKPIRCRIPTIYNLMHFKKWLFFFYTVKIRDISVGEDITTIEENNTEDNMRTKFGILPFGKYDTYCYSERYNSVPFAPENVFNRYKQNNLMRVSKTLVIPKTTGETRYK